MRPDRAAATARLQDALTRYADAKPRTQEWLLKLIDAMYRGKTTSDDQRTKTGQEPLTMIEYMFQHLSGVYGTKDLVNQYSAQLVATCLQCCADPRVATFQRFLMEEWDTRVLSAYLDAVKKLSEPARVACCDFPPDYLPAGARKGESSPVDIRKALWVAEKVLMRRSPKTAYVFAQLLSSRAEPITTLELDSYFVRQFEAGRAEFRRISSSVFLEALCGELARMEAAFREVLPEIFSQYDGDVDGYLTRRDVAALVGEMAAAMVQVGMQLPGVTADAAAAAAAAQPLLSQAGGGGAADAEREALVEAIWSTLLAAEADIRSHADVTTTYPDGGKGGGGGAALAAAVAAEPPPARLATGAAQLPVAGGALAESDLASARETAKCLLSVLVVRHWWHHGPALEALFAEAGGTAEQQLRQHASLLDGDMGGPHGDGRDGPRRAAALCAVLRLLMVKKADRFSSLLTSENLTGGPHNGPSAELEELLLRLTAAVRLLYGPPGSSWVLGSELDELAALSGLDPGDVAALPYGYK
ncbi:hypothetical protein GPECTOR_92g610 [Gonium pectorale]|uniref:EF-hand domain-containing protein n=1 Tax=Gonium pectorale TaxID=33097 RepID=A0A150G0N1_GONPE|nr:hypothetical protein GPECTOR_92g610 [Gonium pectorale]|eukprot:KXZ43387.1 hypothetical protein GPECTOR_92g610 [Gonium pectorale]